LPPMLLVLSLQIGRLTSVLFVCNQPSIACQNSCASSCFKWHSTTLLQATQQSILQASRLAKCLKLKFQDCTILQLRLRLLSL
jgi:hypothetical protein